MAYNNPMTGRPITPAYPVPEIFAAGMSFADQMQMLIAWVNQQVSGLDYVDNDELSQAVAALQSQIGAASSSASTALSLAVSKLEAEIDGLSAGAQIWSLTKGGYGDNQDTVRANALAFDPLACTVDALNGLQTTVSALASSGLNSLGLAAVGCHLTEPSVAPDVSTRYLIKEN